MIQDAANARAQDRLAKVESILAEAAEKIIGLMQQFMVGEQMARMTTVPAKVWFRFTPDHIKGKFDFEVQGGSTEPQNETFRRQSALQIVDASMPFMEAGVVNMPALYQELLAKGFGIKDAARYIKQPEPMAAPGGEPPPGGPPGSPPAPGGPPMGQQPPPSVQQLTPEMMAGMQGGVPAPPLEEGMPPERLQMLAGAGLGGPPPPMM
jgi:hypothetical protein